MWVAVPVGSLLGAFIAQALIGFAWYAGLLIIPNCDEPGLFQMTGEFCPDRFLHWGVEFIKSIVWGVVAVWIPFRIAPSHKRCVAVVFGVLLALFFVGLNLFGMMALTFIPVREFKWLETVNGFITGISALITMLVVWQNYSDERYDTQPHAHSA